MCKVMKVLRQIANNNHSNSLATRLRQRRFALFRSLMAPLVPPIKILDVGGTQEFWERMGFIDQQGVTVVLLNVYSNTPIDANFASVVGDARDLTVFADNEFDIVFSNSVIEHVGTFADQQRMAKEIQRVGKRYFVQTPNRYFLIEPHFLFPFFQFLPLPIRLLLVHRFSIGWYGRIVDKQQALETVASIRLLTACELQELFPKATFYREKFIGLTKSFVVYEGWGN